MKAYKMFNKDMTCRGYQFAPISFSVYEEPEATTKKNGFHCAENPLDCLTYYPNWNESVCWEVDAGGSIDEDGSDTKISCTQLTLIQHLDTEDFVWAAANYICDHPRTASNDNVKHERGETGKYPFAIVRGAEPAARGHRNGEYLCLLKDDPELGEIGVVGLYEVGVDCPADTWINVLGEVIES